MPMTLKIMLPFMVFSEKIDVLRIVAETRQGSFGLLPHRLDCIAVLVSGILIYETEKDGEVLTAVDQGLLVKSGLAVEVIVRRAMNGKNLGTMRQAVEKEFMTLNDQERSVRSVIDKLETGILQRFASLHHD